MKTFDELDERFRQALAEAELALITDGQMKGKVVVAGVGYEVTWGACSDNHEMSVETSIRVWPVPSPSRTAGDTVTSFHAARGDDMPEELRQAILRGKARLSAWERGGPFPATAEELFAP